LQTVIEQKEIAEKTWLSDRTIENRILRLRRELNCKSITHLAITLLREGIIKQKAIMYFLEVYCQVRKAAIFLDISKIVVIESADLTRSAKKVSWVYLDKDYDGQGAYSVFETPQSIVKKIEDLRSAILNINKI
jgi:hypothetical protein